MRTTLPAGLLFILALGLGGAALASEPGEPAACPATTDAASLLPLLDPTSGAVELGTFCTASGATDTQSGAGESCATALLVLRNHIVDAAPAVCDPDPVCHIGSTQITTACYFSAGAYRVEGYAFVKCNVTF